MSTSLQRVIAEDWIFKSRVAANANMIFAGDTIYSYGEHYVLARIDRDTNTVYVNSTPSSKTTGKQRNIVINAAKQYNRKIEFFTVN